MDTDGLTRLVGFGEDLTLESEDFLFDDSDHPTAHLGTVWDFLPVGDEIFGFGSVQNANTEKWRSGYYRFSLAPGRFEAMVLEAPKSDRRWKLTTLARPVLAAAGGSAYGLSFVDTPAIYRLTGTPKRLEAFPPGFDRLPDLPTSRGAASTVAIARAQERSSMVAALHGWGDALYVLTRKPGAAGETLWQLAQIDPEADRLVRILTLPTTAAHLVVAPGPEVWAVIEKGSLERIDTTSGYRPVQEISRMLWLPSSWFADDASPLERGDVSSLCAGGEPATLETSVKTAAAR